MRLLSNFRWSAALAALAFSFMAVVVFLPELHHHPRENAAGFGPASEHEDCVFCNLITAFRNTEPATHGTNLPLELPGVNFQNPRFPDSPGLAYYFPISSRAPPVF